MSYFITEVTWYRFYQVHQIIQTIQAPTWLIEKFKNMSYLTYVRGLAIRWIALCRYSSIVSKRVAWGLLLLLMSSSFSFLWVELVQFTKILEHVHRECVIEVLRMIENINIQISLGISRWSQRGRAVIPELFLIESSYSLLEGCGIMEPFGGDWFRRWAIYAWWRQVHHSIRHQTNKEKDSKQMCPNIYTFVMEHE